MRALLLDLDNTLYEYEPCNHAGIAAVLEQLARHLKVSGDVARQAYDAARARVKQDLHGVAAVHSRLLYIQKAVEALAGRTDAPLVRDLHQRFWDAYCAAMRLYPAAKRLLESCREAGIKVVIVSDLTTDVQLRKLQELGISHLVDAVVTSEEAGAEKPDARIYRLALEKAGCMPGECLMAGDDVPKDVTGAEAFGIRAVHASRDEDFPSVMAALGLKP